LDSQYWTTKATVNIRNRLKTDNILNDLKEQ